MYNACKKSYEELEVITKRLNRFPTVKEWNLYAQKNGLLSNQSMEYILRAKLESVKRFNIKNNIKQEIYTAIHASNCGFLSKLSFFDN